jgi:BRCT domain type II-containing protein
MCCVIYFSKNYKYVKRTRILPAEEASASKENGQAASKPTSAAASSSKPLSGIQFTIIGKTSKKKADFEEVIGRLGGKIAAFGSKTAVCISTKGKLKLAQNWHSHFM